MGDARVRAALPSAHRASPSHAPDPRTAPPRDRERMGLREVQMAGRLGLTLAEYRALEAGELHITFDLYERIVELCGWPR